ncbi:hypothetical protein Q7C_1142 [Methylophaga frappieri]|uniref:Uncharacterized protein n=1 Tax=Methylophaga frappieri (strain ATCC BAA-2434 / DSM 25690 / JAM7) TaxID=754477 RepID=I1YHA4_METFJ|nr:hypothetical protein Q7C_1142 [Methylophaga frappieri]
MCASMPIIFQSPFWPFLKRYAPNGVNPFKYQAIFLMALAK